MDIQQININQDTHPYTNKSLEDNSNFFSKIFFSWVSKIAKFGNKEIFSEKTLFEVENSLKFENSTQNLQIKLDEYYQKNGKYSIGKAIWAVNKKNISIYVLLFVLSGLLSFNTPLILQQILKYITDPSQYNEYYGYMLAALFTLNYPLQTLLNENGWYLLIKTYIQINTQLTYSVYQKVLKLSTSARSQLDQGKIQNLQSIDCNQIQDLFLFGFILIQAPMQLIISSILIIIQVGWVGAIGLGIIFFGCLINGLFISKMTELRKSKLQFTDQKSNCLSEYFQGIRIVKFYGWENMIIEKIMKIRKNETKMILKETLIDTLVDFIFNLMPIFVQITVFGVYVWQGHELTPVVAFTTLTLFNMVQYPLTYLSWVIIVVINYLVSAKRLNFYLSYKEKQGFNDETEFDEQIQNGEILIKQCDFLWEDEESRKNHKEFLELFETNETLKKNIEKKVNEQSLQNEEQEQLKQPLLSTQQLEITEESQFIDKQSFKNSFQQKFFTKPILEDINIRIKKGEFVGIVGQTGSGKTSLGFSMLGEMIRSKGKNISKGKIAYVGQISWLQNSTIRENILFGQEYRQDKYEKIIQICELNDDFKLLQGKDQTEIGEKGLNLSGGQKQRICIARALYSNADIYLLDDSLSALDSLVGEKIFKQVIQDYLKEKTVIFITHGLRFVQNADKVIVLKDGKIVEQDQPQNLENIPNSEFNRLLMKVNSEKKKEEDKEENKEQIKKEKNEEKNEENDEENKEKLPETDENNLGNFKLFNLKGKLVMDEERKIGSVSFKAYKQYFKAGGIGYSIVVLSLCILSVVIAQLNTLWLGAWSENLLDKDAEFYLYIFAAIGGTNCLVLLITNISFYSFARRVSNNINKKLLYSLFRSPMSWFDQTPSGRILNRCTKDQDIIDQELPQSIKQFQTSAITILVLLFISSSVLPIFLGIFFLVIPFQIYITKLYITPGRDTKRIQANLRSPILQQLVESCQGYVEIRTFGQVQNMNYKFALKQDPYIKATYNSEALIKWMQIRILFFSTISVGAAAFLSVTSSKFNYTSSPALIGVAMTSVAKMIEIFGWVVFQYSDLEIKMNSVERTDEWISELVEEKPWNIDNISQDWPTTGEIQGKNVTFRYREGLPNVIKGIDFNIKNHEKIGVVGRTGSGKSTLTLGLLRILEMSEDSNGVIYLDNIKISDVGLHQLRQRVTIIPQDPTLFKGTVRFNLDPFNEIKDEILVEALKKVQIWSQIKTDQPINEQDKQYAEDEMYNKSNLSQEDKEKLYYQINSGGNNFSLGQKQLLCLARGMIKKPRVLLMDEATASIDEYTDHLIQKMIKEEFKETTVITIAHRLKTIIQYDRIMVLDEGNIVEFDSPQSLLDQENGIFKSLVVQQGTDFEQKMRQLALNKHSIDFDSKISEEQKKKDKII